MGSIFTSAEGASWALVAIASLVAILGVAGTIIQSRQIILQRSEERTTQTKIAEANKEAAKAGENAVKAAAEAERAKEGAAAADARAAQADQKAAEANLLAVEADKKAAEANLAAARAIERAAALEKEAAVAKLELARLTRRQSPRSLTQSQRDGFLANIPSGMQGRVDFKVSVGDQEAQAFGVEIAQLFEMAGFTTETSQMLGSLSPPDIKPGCLIIDAHSDIKPQLEALFPALRCLDLQIVVVLDDVVREPLFVVRVLPRDPDGW